MHPASRALGQTELTELQFKCMVVCHKRRDVSTVGGMPYSKQPCGPTLCTVCYRPPALSGPLVYTGTASPTQHQTTGVST